MRKQKGFTLFELLICIVFLFALGGGGYLLYGIYHVAEHFIMKYW